MLPSMESVSEAARLSRAWFASSIAGFLDASPDAILGRLTASSSFDVSVSQRDAWALQIVTLKASLGGLSGSVFLEFTIPRMGRRIDVVLLIGPIVFVVEFKVGEASFDRASIDQVWDYALDLKNFHEGSHTVSIVPVLIASSAKETPPLQLHRDDDGVYQPVKVNPDGFRSTMDRALASVSGVELAHEPWAASSYRPTPTIVEAARALYAQHSVEAIARHDAGAQNLHSTSRRIEDVAREAQEKGHKVICFVTGVPGAGKTLVGLNVATQRPDGRAHLPAVFLSGNGPLVAVLREALTRDEVARLRSQSKIVRKGKVGESIKAFIQNVHHFRDDALIDTAAPVEHIVIFDEAQRAWDLRKTASFMRRKKNQPDFSMSEPEFLISCMNRHKDWAVIICLVGGGQEINDGEAGSPRGLMPCDHTSRSGTCTSPRD